MTGLLNPDPSRFVVGGVSREVADAFERILETHGEVTADLVLAEAEDPGSVLHRMMPRGSRAERLGQLAWARGLIRQVTITVIAKPTPAPVRCLVNVVTPTGRSYLPVITALSDEERQEQLIARCEAELKSMSRRYADFDVFSQVVSQWQTTLRKPATMP